MCYFLLKFHPCSHSAFLYFFSHDVPQTEVIPTINFKYVQYSIHVSPVDILLPCLFTEYFDLQPGINYRPHISLMLLSMLQYLGILLALGDSLVQAVQPGDFESSTEDLVDSNYDLPDPPEQQDNENDQKVTFNFVTK